MSLSAIFFGREPQSEQTEHTRLTLRKSIAERHRLTGQFKLTLFCPLHKTLLVLLVTRYVREEQKHHHEKQRNRYQRCVPKRRRPKLYEKARDQMPQQEGEKRAGGHFTRPQGATVVRQRHKVPENTEEVRRARQQQRQREGHIAHQQRNARQTYRQKRRGNLKEIAFRIAPRK